MKQTLYESTTWLGYRFRSKAHDSKQGLAQCNKIFVNKSGFTNLVKRFDVRKTDTVFIVATAASQSAPHRQALLRFQEGCAG